MAHSRAEASEAVDRAFASDLLRVIMFPAGLCSRQLPGGTIADLRWRPTFVNRALRSGRTIVPVRFSGINSPSFYRFARLRQRSGLKLNIEMALLPREVFRHRGSHFEIRIGHPITPESIAGGLTADHSRSDPATVYTLTALIWNKEPRHAAQPLQYRSEEKIGSIHRLESLRHLHHRIHLTGGIAKRGSIKLPDGLT